MENLIRIWTKYFFTLLGFPRSCSPMQGKISTHTGMDLSFQRRCAPPDFQPPHSAHRAGAFSGADPGLHETSKQASQHRRPGGYHLHDEPAGWGAK